MFKNYLKIFLRNLIKHPGYTISNLSSLAIGMTTCILILLFVRYEYNWNTYNKNYERAYRVQQKVIFKDGVEIYGQTGYQLAAELKKQIPEIENAAVIKNIWSEYLSTSDKLSFNEKNGCYADGNIFKVLTYEFIQGDSAASLSAPYSIVITKELAEKYFPGENAFGKMIKTSKNKSLKVTGIIKNLPFNLDYRPDYFVSLSTYRDVADWKDYEKLENINASIFFTFVTLKPNVSLKAVNDKIYNFTDRYVENNFKKIYLKPLAELHLTANERDDIKIALYYISAFAVFVLALVCINFINLSTANSFLRKKEIGVRKVVGAARSSLFTQFIGETLFFTIIAMSISFVLVQLLLPSFNVIVARQITLNFARDYGFVLLMVLSFIITGILAGIYPALYLSGFQPVQIIKGNVSFFKRSGKGSSKSFLRKALVTLQFCISIGLLVGTVFVVKQVHFMKTKNLGFEKENLLIGSVYGSVKEGSFESFKNELTTNSNILNVAISDNAPFHGNWSKEINWEGAGPNDELSVRYNEISYDFIDTYKMKIVMGRNFSKNFSTDNEACIINETFAKALGWKNPIGKRIDDSKYTIIGVVKDFHPYSVHEIIPPFYMVLNPNEIKNGQVYSIRIKPGTFDESASFVRGEFRSFFPDAIIEVTTFENEIDFGTKSVWEIVEKLFLGFSIIAILIAANGLFGMISFATQRRIKEIGVRKVFGANSPQLYLMISKEYAFILLFAILNALPAGYFVTHTTPGAYKYQMQILDYFFSIGIIVLTALLATVYHTTKAVLSNPVDTLRDE